MCWVLRYLPSTFVLLFTLSSTDGTHRPTGQIVQILMNDALIAKKWANRPKSRAYILVAKPDLRTRFCEQIRKAYNGQKGADMQFLVDTLRKVLPSQGPVFANVVEELKRRQGGKKRQNERIRTEVEKQKEISERETKLASLVSSFLH